MDFICFKTAFIMFVSNLLCLNAAWYNRKKKKETYYRDIMQIPRFKKRRRKIILTRASFFIFYTGEYFIQSKILK